MVIISLFVLRYHTISRTDRLIRRVHQRLRPVAWIVARARHVEAPQLF